MTTILYAHPSCLEHDTGHGHPESPARLKAVLAALAGPGFAALDRRRAPRAQRDQLHRVHAAAYISRVYGTVPAIGRADLAPDTVVSPGSLDAAMHAAGAAAAAVDSVAAGEVRNAFCATRPPGHHAAAANTMGFCVFNNVGVAIEQARAVHGFRRPAVVDFDVHHGNGTEAIYRADPNVLVASIHQSLIFPRSGESSEVGVGNVVNVPLVRETSAADFLRAFEARILPRLYDFRPDFLFLSAGFDAHVRDPLGDQRLKTADFAWLTERLMDLAEACCEGRVVSILEGGYNPEALAHACAAHVRTLMSYRAGAAALGPGSERQRA